jgi:hypothetical protein
MSRKRSAAESVILDQREGIHTFLIEGSRDVILCIVILELGVADAIGSIAFMDSIGPKGLQNDNS